MRVVSNQRGYDKNSAEREHFRADLVLDIPSEAVPPGVAVPGDCSWERFIPGPPAVTRTAAPNHVKKLSQATAQKGSTGKHVRTTEDGIPEGLDVGLAVGVEVGIDVGST